MTLSVPNTNHGSLPPEPTITTYSRCSELMRPVMLTHHGIYYSYLEHKVSEEMNSESDKYVVERIRSGNKRGDSLTNDRLFFFLCLSRSVSPNVYLMEAKRLKHAADTERDLVSQGMQYLEAILSFVLRGHVLERRSQIETAFSMYSETLKLIV